MKTTHTKLAQATALALVLTSFVGCVSSNQKQPANVAGVTGGPNSKTATVTFYRPPDLVGGAFKTSVYVDKVNIADLDSGSYVVVKSTPGTHNLHCEETGESIPVNLVAGKNQFVRVKAVPGAGKGDGVLPNFLPVNLEVGKSYFICVKISHGVLLAVDSATGTNECVVAKLIPSRDIKQPSLVLKGMPQS